MSAPRSTPASLRSQRTPRPSSFPAKPQARCAGLRISRRAGRPAWLSVILLTALASGGVTVPANAQALTVSTPAPVIPPIDSFIAEASTRFAIPAPWIRVVIHVESGGNAAAVSPKGAIGLMQIMPQTWTDLSQRYQLGNDPTSAHDNIIGGTGYLRELYDRFGPTGFLAAYNAGPARYQRYLTDGHPLADKTRRYLLELATALPDLPRDPLLTAASTTTDWRTASLFSQQPIRLAPVDFSVSATPPGDTQAAAQPDLVSRLTPQSADLFAPVSKRSEH